jgi:hypothetical protein
VEEMEEERDYSGFTVYDIVKMVLEDMTSLPVEHNVHVQITIMWRLSELVECGETELYTEDVYEYDREEDEDKIGLVELCEEIASVYQGFLCFKAGTDSDKNYSKELK